MRKAKNVSITAIILAIVLALSFYVFANNDGNEESLSGIAEQSADENQAPATEPLEKGFVDEETLSDFYSRTVFCMKTAQWIDDSTEIAWVYKQEFEPAPRRNIDENYCYSVYETECGGTLFVFFLRDDNEWDDGRCYLRGNKNVIQYVAYVEKPMKMSDFDVLKVGDGYEEVYAVDPGIRYYRNGRSLHLCSDGLVEIRYDKTYDGRPSYNRARYYPGEYTVSEVVKWPDYSGDGLDWIPLSIEKLIAEEKGADLGFLYNPYFTLKIDPADYPQE